MLCYWLNICVSPDSYDEILTLSVMVLGGKGFGTWLSYKSGALMNTISALIQETLDTLFTHLPCKDTATTLQPRRDSHQNLIRLTPCSQISNLQNHKK